MKAIMRTNDVVSWLNSRCYATAAGIIEKIFKSEWVETKDIKMILTERAWRELSANVTTFVPDFKMK